MSTVDELDLSTAAEANNLSRMFTSFGLALLYYDAFLTLPLEVERFWTGHQSWASAFFYLNRYTSILFHIPVIFESFYVMPEWRCRQLHTFHQLSIALGQGIVAVCLLLRTHALYMRNRRILYFLGVIVALGVVVCVWTIVWSGIVQYHAAIPGDEVIPIGCVSIASASQSTLLAVSWSVMFVFDGAVFALTLRQAICFSRLWNRSLATIMLKDGEYYAHVATVRKSRLIVIQPDPSRVLGICYLSNIVTYAIASPWYRGNFTTATNILSTVLVSRMMLNIRDPTLFELSHSSPSKFSEISIPDYMA